MPNGEIPHILEKLERLRVGLEDQNIERAKTAILRTETDLRIFQKLDTLTDSHARATLAVTQAVRSAGEAKEQGKIIIARLDHQDASIMPRFDAQDVKLAGIDATTKATNGRVNIIEPKVEVLTKERKQRILDEEAAKLKREGLLVLPKTLGAALLWLWKNAVNPGLKFLGLVAIAYPVLHWLWTHRIFWGH